MENAIVWIILGMVVSIIILNRVFKEKKDNRQQYLDALVKHLGASIGSIKGYDNSYELKFEYKGHHFTYTDIEDPGFQTRSYRGILKAQTNDNLTMSFTESNRLQLRSEINSISDVVAPWEKNIDKLRLPKELHDFTVFTNNLSRATALVADEQIIKTFLRFKNVDSRGHPVMSLEIIEGVVTLKFHPLGSSLIPYLFDLQNSPTSIDAYLEKILTIINKINQLKAADGS